MFKPEAAGQAEMWGDDAEAVADKIAALIAERGWVKA
jgi:hypothetical protein